MKFFLTSRKMIPFNFPLSIFSSQKIPTWMRAVTAEYFDRNIGYRQMTQRFVNNHLLAVGQEIVRKLLKIIYPYGVELGAQHRLKNRQHWNRGPNNLWHIDGYLKLRSWSLGWIQ